VDRVDTAGEISVSTDEPYVLTDTSENVSWEDDEWNGHRIVLYQAETVNRTLPDGSTIQDERIDRGTIQERIIVDTRPNPDGDGYQLIVSPPFDYDLCQLVGAGYHLSYMILGCDGLVEHEAAIKAYDVVHHTTQRDFEQYKAQATKTETGPYPFGTTADPTAATLDDACKVDGWIALAKKKAESSDANALVQNFDGTSFPARADMVRDLFENQNGRITSEGLLLRSATNDHFDLKTANPLVTANHSEGGFVSFWFRPHETFFSGSGTRTLVQVFGSSTTEGQEEDIRLVADGGQLKVIVRANKEETHSANIKFRTADVREHSDTNYSNISSWQPGEWHHIAFAWYECDDTTATDDDGSDATSKFDDDGGEANQELDDEVKGRLRLWVDGQSSELAAANEVYAFNLTPPASGPNLRFGDQVSGTIDGIIVRRHSDPSLNFTVAADLPRYDADDTNHQGTFETNSIDLNLETGDHVALGTVSWTGWLPWCAETERWDHWDESTSKFPIWVEVALGSSLADSVPKQGAYRSPLGGGGPLRSGSSIILDDITITYLGPVVFFFWR